MKLDLIWGNRQRFTELTEECMKTAVQRPWGYEIRADFIDDKRINLTITGVK